MTQNQLVSEKLAQAIQICEEFNVDMWLVLVRETSMISDPMLPFIADIDVTWLSAFIVERNGRLTAIVGHFDAENVPANYTNIIPYHQSISEPLLQFLNEANPQTIGINYSENDVSADGLSHGLYRKLCGFLDGSPFVDRLVSAEKMVAALRGRKSPAEVALIQQAIKTTEALFDEVEAFAKPGMTQRQIAAFVHGRIDEMGLGYAWPKPFNPIVTCGPHSAIGHVIPGDVVLEKGHLLHLDLGVKEAGYCSDLQRMWYVLEDGETAVPADVERAFQVVYGALKTGETYLKRGTPGWQVDEVAREFIVDNGFPEYMHAFGHLLGRAAHDGATVLGPRWERYAGICDMEVEVGNVFTLELHVVVPNRGIMSLEEDVLVTDEGVVYLSHPQTAMRLI
ncbi:MAG: Xaa-Pro peptidase family protein [Chloroflexota bacterium]